MHEVHEPLSPGAVIRSRYLVIDLLGRGGFSAVYLVQDQQRGDGLFALKEVIIAEKKASEHFTFEYNLLKRLVHPALPRVHDVFDNEEHNRLYMLMDYIEGPNLETLRHIQHEKRFSLPVLTAILTPIVDAIEYLHQQNPPIVHRDIKPSNIIVPLVERKTILVDFGIAKEFDKQGTTSAIRYGSYGYGAPEQYSAGTNTRTDIYGLGATLYTLLTGEVAPDALDRMTQISNDKPDPLKPASELVPSIPLPASRAIGRALSINMKQRFATAQEFWHALQGESGQQPHISEALNSIVVSPSTSEVSGKIRKTTTTTTQPLQVNQLPDRRSRKRLLLPVLLALLVFVGIGTSYWGFTVFRSNQAGTPVADHATVTTPTPIAHTTVTVTVTLTPNPGPKLVASYKGTITDLQADVQSQMTLSQIQQNNGHISGSFSGMNTSGTFIGFLDASKQISFIVSASNGSGQFSFTGAVQPDGSLKGTFGEINQSGQYIIGPNGVWRVAPVTTR